MAQNRDFIVGQNANKSSNDKTWLRDVLNLALTTARAADVNQELNVIDVLTKACADEIENVILGADHTLNPNDKSQLLKSINKLISDRVQNAFPLVGYISSTEPTDKEKYWFQHDGQDNPLPLEIPFNVKVYDTDTWVDFSYSPRQSDLWKNNNVTSSSTSWYWDGDSWEVFGVNLDNIANIDLSNLSLLGNGKFESKSDVDLSNITQEAFIKLKTELSDTDLSNLTQAGLDRLSQIGYIDVSSRVDYIDVSGTDRPGIQRTVYTTVDDGYIALNITCNCTQQNAQGNIRLRMYFLDYNTNIIISSQMALPGTLTLRSIQGIFPCPKDCKISLELGSESTYNGTTAGTLSFYRQIKQ